MAPSRHDRKIVYWDVKQKRNGTKNKRLKLKKEDDHGNILMRLIFFLIFIQLEKIIQCKQTVKIRVVSGLPGAKVCRGTKLSSDQSQMYNIATVGLPTTIPVHLNR